MGRRVPQGRHEAERRLTDREDAGILPGRAPGGAVGRTVVDEDEAPVAKRLAADGRDRAGERRRAVADRKPDVETRQKNLSGGNPKTS